jgi:hypothetical protein
MAVLLLVIFILILIGVLGVLSALWNEVKAREALEKELRRNRRTCVIAIAQVRVPSPPPRPVVRKVRISRVRVLRVRPDIN